MTGFSSRAILLLALIALTALVYIPGLGGGFIFDDYPNIVTNPLVHAESLTWDSLSKAAHAYNPGVYGRPLATVSFAVDYFLGGKDAWQFKLTSVLVHLINALLVFWLLRRLLPLSRSGATWTATGAFAIALLWAIHPLQVSSVLYVVQRMETLSLTFVLLALIAYLHGRTMQRDGRGGWPWIIGSGALAAVGMLSKETAALFPAFALALELTVLGFEARSPRTTRILKVAYAVGVSATVIVFAVWVLPQYTAPGAFAGRDFTLYERLLTQLRVLPMYMGQVLLPLPSTLTFYYDSYPKSTGWLHPATTLLGGAFLLTLLVAAWRVRKPMPLAALGIFWFFCAHLLTSNVFNLELAFEHRNYFALLGILLTLGDLVSRIPMRDGPALKYVAIGAITLGFGALATLRSASWGNELHLAMELAARNPDSPRASSDLGTLYAGMADGNIKSPFHGLSEAEFERGSLLPNSSPLPEQALILVAAANGQPVKEEWWDRFIHKIETRPIGPQETMAVTGMMKQRYAGIAVDDKRLSEAYSALLARKRMPAHFYAQYGDFALTYLKDEDLADRMFLAAVERSRNDSEYVSRIVSALAADGRIRQMTVVLERAHSLGLLTSKPGASQPAGAKSP